MLIANIADRSDGLSGSVRMALTTHIVLPDASDELHSLPEAQILQLWQTVYVAKQEKNGGPNHLKAWREYRGLSQEELADKVGTIGSTISMLELGERGLSLKWLRKLAPALDTTPGHLADLDPHEMDGDVIDIWATASTRQRSQIVQIAKTIVRTGTDD